MAFNGFPKDATKFLKDLAKNNDRDWFSVNKTRFKENVEGPAKEFVEAMTPVVSQIAGEPMAGKIFRIYRDVRFSKDKTPYNAHVRVLFFCIDVESTCGNKPVFCFSLERNKVITGTGSGTMEFTKETLESFRQSVHHDATGKTLVKLLKKYDNVDGYRIDPPSLKRVPAGFDKDHQREALLRHKALMVWHEDVISPDVYSSKITSYLGRRYKKMKPIYDWINAL